MASVWENFELGAAGLGDLIGVTDGHAAARLFTEQTVPQNATPEQAAQVLASATAAEDAGGLETAAAATVKDVGDAGKAVARGFWSGLRAPLLVGGAVLVGVLFLVYAPELKALRKAA